MNARKTCYIILVVALVMSLPIWAGAQELERTTFTGSFFNIYGQQWLRFNTSDFVMPPGDGGGWVGDVGASMFFKGTTIWGGTLTTPCTISGPRGNGVLKASWGEEVYSVVVMPCTPPGLAADSTDEPPSAPAVVTVYKPWDPGLAAGGKLLLCDWTPGSQREATFGFLYMLGGYPTLGVSTPTTLGPGNPVRLLLQDPFNPKGPVTIWALNSFTATVTCNPINNVMQIDLFGRAWFQQGSNPPKFLYLKASLERMGPTSNAWVFDIELTRYPNCLIYEAESYILDGGVFADLN